MKSLNSIVAASRAVHGSSLARIMPCATEGESTHQVFELACDLVWLRVLARISSERRYALNEVRSCNDFVCPETVFSESAFEVIMCHPASIEPRVSMTW
jgi:hypothetical protein